MIINIGSVAGREAYAGGMTLTRSLRETLRPMGQARSTAQRNRPSPPSTAPSSESSSAPLSEYARSSRVYLLHIRSEQADTMAGMVETEFSVIRFRGDKKAADEVYKGLDPCASFFPVEELH